MSVNVILPQFFGGGSQTVDFDEDWSVAKLISFIVEQRALNGASRVRLSLIFSDDKEKVPINETKLLKDLAILRPVKLELELVNTRPSWLKNLHELLSAYMVKNVPVIITSIPKNINIFSSYVQTSLL
jgi:hypothetical protein